MTFFSKRVQSIPPSGIREFFDLVMSSQGIISLGVGEPDFLTPWGIRDEAMHRIQTGTTSYTSNKGLTELRSAIANYLNIQFDIHYAANELLITNGVSEAVDLVMRSIIDPGDAVLLPEPTYVCYRPLIELCDGVPIPINTTKTGFSITAKAIEAHLTPKTKAIVLCYPNNPTGQSIPWDELQKIADIAHQHDLIIISDEIYAALSFEPFHSIAKISSIKDRLIYLNGFSKAHAMTGWRIGYIAAPEPVIETINKIHQYSALCAPTVSQYAAIEACKNTQSDVQKMAQSYQERARYFTKKMNDIGIDSRMPSGGLYVFSSIASTGLSSIEFAKRLLKEANVAVVPGMVFGNSGEGYIRACIATDFDQLKQAVTNITAFVQAL
ncbi:MAG: aminotransferase class I/II-fold pyridoxal phosphate-dependent enzyme [Candidatus Marinamargulisbacteria bacterium]